VVSIITNESVDSLGLKEQKEAYAVIKASSVMIAVD
jgi:molybdopterin-binding protein